MAVSPMPRRDAAYRDRQRMRRSNLAQQLGAIGELFLLKKEREAKARQQELENRIKLAKLDLDQERLAVSKGQLTVAQGQLKQREKEHQDALDKYREALKNDAADKEEKRKDLEASRRAYRGALEAGVYQEHGDVSADHNAIIDGIIAASEKGDSSTVANLNKRLFPSGNEGRLTDPRWKIEQIKKGLFTEDPRESPVFFKPNPDKPSLGEKIIQDALKVDPDPTSVVFSSKVLEGVRNAYEGGLIKGYGDKPDMVGLQQLLEKETADYLINNMGYATGLEGLDIPQTRSQALEEDYYSRSRATPPPAAPTPEDRRKPRREF